MIKASYEVIQPHGEQSFLIRRFDGVAFNAPYHFHEELELTLISQGNGKRYVGNHMEDFSPGDLVLIGSNLPHCWKLDKSDQAEISGSAIVIQFTKTFLGDCFFEKTELKHIKKLLQRSCGGIRFDTHLSASLSETLLELSEEKNSFKVLIGLLEVLERLAVTTAYTLLDQNNFTAERTPAEQERINPVIAYMVENFRSDINLNTAAAIAHMTPNAFCKYFKKATRKTFIETIIDYSMNYAKQQLIQTDKPVSDISFESGFGDLSHFYKMFKIKMGLSPLNYRKRFMNSVNGIDNVAV
jgi:AraC-like DNA-binding protein